MIAHGATLALSVKFLFIVIGESLRHRYSFQIRRKSRLSSLEGSYRATSVCVVGLLFIRFTSESGRLGGWLLSGQLWPTETCSPGVFVVAQGGVSQSFFSS